MCRGAARNTLNIYNVWPAVGLLNDSGGSLPSGSPESASHSCSHKVHMCNKKPPAQSATENYGECEKRKSAENEEMETLSAHFQHKDLVWTFYCLVVRNHSASGFQS